MFQYYDGFRIFRSSGLTYSCISEYDMSSASQRDSQQLLRTQPTPCVVTARIRTGVWKDTLMPRRWRLSACPVDWRSAIRLRRSVADAASRAMA
jgi:hypothetical protein